MLSLPAAKGFEIGSGFAGTLPDRQPSTTTRSTTRRRARRARARNRSGGIQGGISNGEDDHACASRSSRRRRSCASRRPSTTTGTTPTIKARGPPRSVRAAARGADRRGDDGARARRPLPPTARPVRTSKLVAVVLAAVAGAGCRGRAAFLLAFDAGAAGPTTPTEEPRQVHFSYTGPDEVTFVWRGVDPTLRVWSKSVATRELKARPPTPGPTSSPGPWQEAVVGGLQPGMDYFYEAGAGRHGRRRRRSARRYRPGRPGSASSPSATSGRRPAGRRRASCTG